MNIYPSILTDSIKTAQKQLNLVKDNDAIKTVQIDIIDGQFADNLTITPLDLLDLDFGSLKIDLHLMVEEPMDYVYELVTVEKQLPTRAVIAQVERMTYFDDYIEEIKKHDWKVGLSLDLHTPVSEVSAVLPKLDILQLMSIEAGFQGQEFQEKIFEKITLLRQSFVGQENIELILDGGVKPEHVTKLKKASVGGVAVGSALWQAEDLQKTMKQFTS